MARIPATEISRVAMLLSVVAITVSIALCLWYITTHDQPPHEMNIG
jgi:hypothetical protein